MTPPLRVPAVAAILTDPAGAALLLQRDEKPGLEFPGWWTLPGGKVEDGETPDEAIRRELLEEIELAPPLTHWQTYERPHHRQIDGRAVIVVQHIYSGAIDRPAEAITQHEGQALGFFSLADLSRLPIAYGFAALLQPFFTRTQEYRP